MWFSIISSIVFLAITVLLFTPELRKFPIYRSLAFFFLFEGIYILLGYVVTEMWPKFNYMPNIHDIGCVILGLYILITTYNYREKEASKINTKSSSKIETPTLKTTDSKSDEKQTNSTAKKSTSTRARKTTASRTTKKSTRAKTGKTSSTKNTKKQTSTKAN